MSLLKKESWEILLIDKYKENGKEYVEVRVLAEGCVMESVIRDGALLGDYKILDWKSDPHPYDDGRFLISCKLKGEIERMRDFIERTEKLLKRWSKQSEETEEAFYKDMREHQRSQ